MVPWQGVSKRKISQCLCVFTKFVFSLLCLLLSWLSLLLTQWVLVYVGVLILPWENERSTNGSWHKAPGLLLPYFCCPGAEDTHTHTQELKHKYSWTTKQATLLCVQINIATCLHVCAPPAARTHTHKDTQRDTLVSFPAVILLLTLESRADERIGRCAGEERTVCRERDVVFKRFPWVLRIHLLWKGLMELN